MLLALNLLRGRSPRTSHLLWKGSARRLTAFRVWCATAAKAAPLTRSQACCRPTSLRGPPCWLLSPLSGLPALPRVSVTHASPAHRDTALCLERTLGCGGGSFYGLSGTAQLKHGERVPFLEKCRCDLCRKEEWSLVAWRSHHMVHHKGAARGMTRDSVVPRSKTRPPGKL